MEKLRFRSVPSVAHYEVPFALNERALADWLHGLAVKQNYHAGKEVFCVLQALIRMHISPQQHLKFLTEISAFLEELAGQLEKNYLDASFPLELEAQAQVDIVTFAYATLAKNYALAGEELIVRTGRSPDIALALMLALEAAGKALLHISQVYMQPYEGFWLFCHQIYLLAEENGLLNLEINSGKGQGKTIDAAYKQVLLFDLADSSQFRPREMKAIYHFLNKFSVQAKIFLEHAQERVTALCLFNLNQDQPPKALRTQHEGKDAADRYVSVLAAKNLYQFLQHGLPGHGATKAINRELLARLVKSLAMAQKRRHNRVVEQGAGVGLLGFNNVIGFLYKRDFAERNNLLPVQQRDTRIAGHWQVPNLDLVPEGSEWMHQMETHYRKKTAENSPINKILKLSRELPSDAGVWKTSGIGKNKFVDDIPTGEFEILNSSAHGFRISWKSDELKVKIGDIFAMPSVRGDRLEIGLIRRIAGHTQEAVQLAIEVIGFESELIGLVRQGRIEKECWAILLPGIRALKQADSVVLNAGNYSEGDFITLRRGRQEIECRLHKLINSTSAVTHMELLYP